MDATAGDELAFVESRPMGAAYVLDGAWRRLGIDKTLVTLLKGRKLDARAERVLFALVANRAIDPSSKLAATTWAAQRVAIDGLDSLDSDACYRAMDWLLEIEPELAEAVYWSVADLLNLEVDVLFFDTTSTYLLRDRTSRRPHRRRDGGVPDLRALQGSPALLRTSDPTLSAEDIALGLQAAPRGRTRLAGHEVHPRAAPSTTGSNTASAPTCSCAGSPCC